MRIGLRKFGPCSSKVFGARRLTKQINPTVFSTTNSGTHFMVLGTVSGSGNVTSFSFRGAKLTRLVESSESSSSMSRFTWASQKAVVAWKVDKRFSISGANKLALRDMYLKKSTLNNLPNKILGIDKIERKILFYF